MCDVASGLFAINLAFIRRRKKRLRQRPDQLSANLWVRHIKRGWDQERANPLVCCSSCLAAVTMTTGWTQECGARDFLLYSFLLFLPSLLQPASPLDPPSLYLSPYPAKLGLTPYLIFPFNLNGPVLSPSHFISFSINNVTSSLSFPFLLLILLKLILTTSKSTFETSPFFLD